MLVRILLVVAVAVVGALFGAGPIRAGAHQAMAVEAWWGLSPSSALIAVFGLCGLVPALTTLGLLLAAARQRRLGQAEAASSYEGWAKLFVGSMFLAQIVMVPYHESRLTGAQQVGTVVKLGPRTERNYKSGDVTFSVLEVEVSVAGKTNRISARISDEDAKRVKVGDRIDTFSTSDESYLGTGAPLSEIRAFVGAIAIVVLLGVLVSELFDKWKKARSPG